MLQPKRTKFRKAHKGRIHGVATSGATLSFGQFGLKAMAPERITATLKRAFASPDVVFSCGGIGATPDDHTRQCAGQALGLPLALHGGTRRQGDPFHE